MTVARIIELMEKVELDPAYIPQFWDMDAIKTALHILKKRSKSDKAYLVVKRGRDLVGPRGERKGIISAAKRVLLPQTLRPCSSTVKMRTARAKARLGGHNYASRAGIMFSPSVLIGKIGSPDCAA